MPDANAQSDSTDLIRTKPHPRIQSLDWRPPSNRLPGCHASIRIENCRPEKPAHERQREPDHVGSRAIVYHGFDEQKRERLVLQFRISPVELPGHAASSDSRHVLDLQSPGAGGPFPDWPATVVVTRLGAVLKAGRRSHDVADPGDIQESFLIEDFLGQGGFGEVWAAVDRNEPDPQRRSVALKFQSGPGLLTDLGESAEAASGLSLTRETRRKGLENFVIPYRREFNLILPDNEPGWPRRILVMDRAGGSLEDVIQKFSQPDGPRLPAETVSRICRRLIVTLNALHGLHWVHRDLKPANVLLRFRDGRTWDQSIESLDQAGILLGDVASLLKAGTIPSRDPDRGEQLKQDTFKAPELFLRAAKGSATEYHDNEYAAHPAEDLYALGRIFERLAACLTGDAKWLLEIAGKLQDPVPSRRPRPTRQLLMDVSPRWQAQSELLRQSQWRIADPAYERLVGREWVRDAFEDFCRRQTDAGQGGVFLLIAEPGVGKTAILTHWNTIAGLGSRDTARRSIAAPAPETANGPDDIGLHPAFYLRFDKGNSVQSWLIPQLAKQLAAAPWNAPLPERLSTRDLGPGDLREMLRHASRSLSSTSALVMILDGLDEADDPYDAVSFVQQLCSQGLPPHVFLLTSSRPKDADGRDHLTDLVKLSGIVLPWELRKDDPRNLADAEKFWTEESQRMFESDADIATARQQAAQIVRNNSGIFFILRSALDEIAAGRLSLQEFMEQEVCRTVIDWHEQQWGRLKKAVEKNHHLETRLVELATALAVIREPVGDQLFANWLGMSVPETELVRVRLSWLMSELRGRSSDGVPVVLWDRKHKSVLDFLAAPPKEHPDSSGQSSGGPAYAGLKPMHHQIAHWFLAQARSDKSGEAEWSWGGIEDEYGLRHVVAHLLACSGPLGTSRQDFDLATTLLRDQCFLDARLNH